MDHPAPQLLPQTHAFTPSSLSPPYIACVHGAGRAMQAYHTIRTFIDTFQTYICMCTVRCAQPSGCTFPMTKQLPGSRNTTASNYESLAS